MNPDLSVIARFGLLDEAAVLRAQRGLRQLARSRRRSQAAGQQATRPGARSGLLRTTVEAHLAADRCRVGEDLLRHLLAAHQHEDACVELGSWRWGWEEAWARWVLDPGVRVSVPSPGEPADELAMRILETLGALGLQAERRDLWHARVLALAAAGGEGALGVLERIGRGTSPLAAQARVDRAALLLERGEVGEASRLLAAATGDPRAAVLQRWIGALHGRGSGERDAAPRGPAGAGASAALVPAFLVELRERRPAMAPELAGAPRLRGRLAPREDLEDLLVGRAWALMTVERGAASLRAGHDPRGSVRRLQQWAQGRREAWRQDGDPARRAALDRELLIARPAEGQCLDPSTRAVVLLPLPAEARAGWLQVEWPHEPQVSAARLRRALEAGAAILLRAAADEVARASHAVPAVPPVTSVLPAPPDPIAPPALRTRSEPGIGPARPTLDQELLRLVDEALAPILRRHRSWRVTLVEERGGALRAVGAAGAAPDRPARTPSSDEARAVRRALVGGAALVHRGGEQEGWDARARRGVMVPLEREETPCGSARSGPLRWVVACESPRAGEIPAGLVAGLSEAASALLERLEAACLEAWFEERLGWRPVRPRGAAAHRRRVERVRQAALARAPLVLVGPAGTGKHTLATCASWWATGQPPLDLGSAAGERCVVLSAPEALSPRAQAQLLEAWSGGRPRHLVVTSRQEPARWPLRPELAALLRGDRVSLPALASERGELRAWLAALLEGAARSEGRTAPRLTPEAEAWLWRQAWPDSLRGLDQVALRLAVQGGEEVGLEEARSLLTPLGLVPEPRLRIGPASDGDLHAAAAWCRTRGGRLNRAELGRWMGWDERTASRRAAAARIPLDHPGPP